MEFEWDEAKRLSNLAKHGFDFAEVAKLDLSGLAILPDLRFAYGEERFRAFAALDGKLCSIAFTRRADVIRIVSVRRANRKGRKIYGS